MCFGMIDFLETNVAFFDATHGFFGSIGGGQHPLGFRHLFSLLWFRIFKTAFIAIRIGRVQGDRFQIRRRGRY